MGQASSWPQSSSTALQATETSFTRKPAPWAMPIPNKTAKRSVTPMSDDEGEASGKLGPKEGGDAASESGVTKRTLQDRKAQREFRKRRGARVRDLEERCRRFDQMGFEANAELQWAARRLKHENEALRDLLVRLGFANMISGAIEQCDTPNRESYFGQAYTSTGRACGSNTSTSTHTHPSISFDTPQPSTSGVAMPSDHDLNLSMNLNVMDMGMGNSGTTLTSYHHSANAAGRNALQRPHSASTSSGNPRGFPVSPGLFVSQFDWPVHSVRLLTSN